MAKASFFSFVPQISLTFGLIPLLILVGITCFASVLSSSSSDPFSLQQRDRVLKLPGQSFNVNFDHYAGYVTVNKESGRNLFYWFIEAAHDPESKPLVLWLNGGPGCSSIAGGETEEIGPFQIQSDGKTVDLNPHTWNQVANLLFVESPVGVGFSYSNTPSDLLNSGDKRTAKDNLKFLLNWFERFPQYKGRDFYIAGESYAGHYVPQLSQLIVKYNRKYKEDINLKGYIVGNSLIDDYHDHLGISQFLWSSGMISDKTYQQMNIECNHESLLSPSSSCQKVKDIAEKEMGTVDPYSIFTNRCPNNSSHTNQLMKRKHILGGLSRAYDPCTKKHSVAYFNLPEVQKALHIDPDHKPEKWLTCNLVVNENWKDSPSTVLDIYRELISQGLRIWVFSGDTDSVVPVTSTRHSINAMKLQTVSDWHAWYDDGQVGGWTQEYDGLTFVVIRGSGHKVPLHRPKLALALIKAFLAGFSMPSLELHSAF